MKKIIGGMMLVGVALAMTGCCLPQGPYATPSATGIVVDHVAPGAYTIDNSVQPQKVGKATTKGVVLFTTGDNSIKAAMENGGITKIHHIDFDVVNVFNLYSRVTTIVYGE